MTRLIAVTAALLLPATAVPAASPQPGPQAGETYSITTNRESSQQSNDGSSGSSTDRDALVERIIAVRDTGLELEYDLPDGTTAEDRARDWKFPARIFQPIHGEPQLLNAAEMKVRIDRWLKSGGMTRAACGHWAFSWTAYQIDCDPQSVIRMIQSIGLRPEGLREGALYRDRRARTPVPLTKKEGASGGETFVAEMTIDPGAIRRERAQSDVIVAELSKKTLTLDDALRAHKEEISGTIKTTFDTNSAGQVRRRTTITRVIIKGPGERVETDIVTETAMRHPIAAKSSTPTI